MNRDAMQSLNAFHPETARWFREEVGTPSPVQSMAWPVIAGGEHALVTAPTGSGKTLTAFLWGLDRLLTGAWPTGGVRLLYISPLKALNNDVQRNLLGPLDALRARFAQQGLHAPDVHVAVRSGDTEQKDRQRMVRRPPEILITTPESLNLILSSKRARSMLSTVQTVILDEIHAVAGSKRGVHLMTAVDRMVLLAGEFQRIALSATVRPLETVAEFVGGAVREAPDVLTPRPVRIIAAPGVKTYDLRVDFPGDASEEGEQAVPLFNRLAEELRAIIESNRSTLVFTGNRRHCERLSMLINDAAEDRIAYSHHGSLSRETRSVVEERLKKGELRAIVATSSLELGIDVGALDAVVMVQSPTTVASALQRLGRAGHQVGAVSRGLLFPLFGRDLVDAAVMARLVREQAIEPLRPVRGALDVLAQVVASMTSIETWDLDDLYDFIRTSWPYRDLSRRHYELVLEMLAGRYADGSVRGLEALVSVDRIDNVVQGKDASLRRIYSSGGSIPDRGYYTMRRNDTGARLGELDEEFVWEQRRGTVFSLGMQSWRIVDITHNDVLVEPSPPKATDVPFWRAEELDRSGEFSERIALFLEAATSKPDEELERDLEDAFAMTPRAASSLAEFLRRQRAAAGEWPHRHRLLVEMFDDSSDSGGIRAILHTLWGGRVNRPLSVCLAQAWREEYGQPIETYANNDCVVAVLPGRVDARELVDLVKPDAVERLLRAHLEETGFFGARFRENAARALLLPRQHFGRRMPLWLNRLRSKNLLSTVARYEDFPILIETWRTCLQDDFELDWLRSLLDEVASGEIGVDEVHTTTPSPFAEGAVWRLTNIYMYQDDTPSGGPTSLSDELIQQAVFSPDLRPRIPAAVAEAFEAKAQRTFAGYAPGNPADLLDWAKERLWIPADEWEALLAAAERDHEVSREELMDGLGNKIFRAQWKGGAAVAAVEMAPRLGRALGDAAGLQAATLEGEVVGMAAGENADAGPAFLAEWLRFYGPRTLSDLAVRLPLAEDRLREWIEALEAERQVVSGPLLQDVEEMLFCEAENVERLLRLTRAAARPSFEAQPLNRLPQFLARQQRVGESEEALEEAVEPLMGCPLPVGLLESEVLPARVPGYAAGDAEYLFAGGRLEWIGVDERKVVLTPPESRELFQWAVEYEDDALWEQVAPKLFPDLRARYSFSDLLEFTGLNAQELMDSLWEFAWKGRVSNDSLAALRQGVEKSFKAPESPAPRPARFNRRSRAAPRARLNAPRAALNYPGAWRMVPQPPADDDALELEELNQERVRVLLDRCGVLFRELLDRELPCLQWPHLFRALRRMELSGEVFAGQFFEGVPGVQFASASAVHALRQGFGHDSIFWLNAQDPASCAGLDLPGLKADLPRRVAGNHLVYRGADLVVVSQRSGKSLTIHLQPDDPLLKRCFGFMDNLLARRIEPVASIGVEEINGAPALKSPYLPVLRDLFDVAADAKRVNVWRRGG